MYIKDRTYSKLKERIDQCNLYIYCVYIGLSLKPEALYIFKSKDLSITSRTMYNQIRVIVPDHEKYLHELDNIIIDL